MKLTPLADLPVNGDLKTETWPEYILGYDPTSKGDNLVALLRHLLMHRRRGLYVQTIISITTTPNPVIQVLIGGRKHSRKVMVAPGIDPIGLIRLFEDDGLDGFQFEPKETGAVTFEKLLDDPYGALNLGNHPNSRIQVASPQATTGGVGAS